MSGNFTHKAQEAIMQAQTSAQERNQQQIDALHLLNALLSQEGSVVLNLLQRLGADIEILDKTNFLQPEGGVTSLEFVKIDYEIALKTLAQIRGGQRITDPEPESKYQVIEKYARNLTQLARKGKLNLSTG